MKYLAFIAATAILATRFSYAGLLEDLKLNKSNPKDRELIMKCDKESEFAQIKISDYFYVYDHLNKFHDKFNIYPAQLDSLTKLDSVDYSYMRTAWKIDYKCIDECRDYLVDDLNKAEIKNAKEGKNFGEFINSRAEKAFRKCVQESK